MSDFEYCDGTYNGDKFLGRWYRTSPADDWTFTINSSCRYLTQSDVNAIACKLDELNTQSQTAKE